MLKDSVVWASASCYIIDIADAMSSAYASLLIIAFSKEKLNAEQTSLSIIDISTSILMDQHLENGIQYILMQRTHH